MCKNISFSVIGWSDFHEGDHTVPNFIKLFKHTKFHPMARKLLRERIDMLDSLVKVGIIDKNNAENFLNGRILQDSFYRSQEELISKSLNNYSKTAWVRQDYLAQNLHRSLRKSGKYSDVSRKSYTKHKLSFNYERSYVPSSILRRFSWMRTNGLFEWWPNFINRTGIILGGEHVDPPTPNISGNILVVFVLLGGGLSIASACLVYEMREKIVLFISSVYKSFATKLYIIIFRIAGFNKRFHSNVVIFETSQHS